MVVVTGREPDSRRPDGAMSSSDAEDDFLEPATPTATQAGHALPLLPQEFPEVVPLNIGGAHFTTRLSTLRRYEDTMLAAMFSGRHYIPTDSEGRYFIDRDGTHFGQASWRLVQTLPLTLFLSFSLTLCSPAQRRAELPALRGPAAAGARAGRAQGGAVLRHRAAAGAAGEHAAAQGREGAPGLPGAHALLQRPLGADRGDRPAAGGAAEGPLRQAQGLRLQGGDARHALRVPPAQLPALRAQRERRAALRAPL
ncbi:BTB/POZ domain-containing protein KCTD7 isoform X2 [Sciurus carolinensis]|uniref:BTB/POZ domain-containing protein KCTD7 isoform X2 n=1 Tax=Sciurus carolinensis TaxID=30640 RepID=UPI001FB3114C|nr:BTB/POZ domain-containing protein KCTD7 isoform X2 [Sciurus carolinensis]